MSKREFEADYEKMMYDHHRGSIYLNSKKGGLHSDNPGVVDHRKGIPVSTRPNAVAYYNQLASEYKLGSMVEGKMPIRGLDINDWPTNNFNTGTERVMGAHIYPAGNSMKAYFKLGADYLYDIRSLIQQGKNVEAQQKIGHYYHVMLNARPYDQINNSIFANQANYLLKLTGHKGIQQGHLDHVMMRMSSDQIDKFWPHVLNGKVKNANHYGIDGL